MKEKLGSLTFLQTMKTTIVKSTFKQMGAKAAQHRVSTDAIVLTVKHVARVRTR